MGTKTNPGPFDCYAAADPDEPIFILTARDPAAPDAIEDWADIRSKMIRHGTKPDSDWQMIFEARAIAQQMRDWRGQRRNTVAILPLPAPPIPFDPVRFANLLTRARDVIDCELTVLIDSFRTGGESRAEVLADTCHGAGDHGVYAEMNEYARLLAEIDAALGIDRPEGGKSC